MTMARILAGLAVLVAAGSAAFIATQGRRVEPERATEA